MNFLNKNIIYEEPQRSNPYEAGGEWEALDRGQVQSLVGVVLF